MSSTVTESNYRKKKSYLVDNVEKMKQIERREMIQKKLSVFSMDGEDDDDDDYLINLLGTNSSNSCRSGRSRITERNTTNRSNSIGVLSSQSETEYAERLARAERKLRGSSRRNKDIIITPSPPSQNSETSISDLSSITSFLKRGMGPSPHALHKKTSITIRTPRRTRSSTNDKSGDDGGGNSESTKTTTRFRTPRRTTSMNKQDACKNNVGCLSELSSSLHRLSPHALRRKTKSIRSERNDESSSADLSSSMHRFSPHSLVKKTTNIIHPSRRTKSSTNGKIQQEADNHYEESDDRSIYTMETSTMSSFHSSTDSLRPSIDFSDQTNNGNSSSVRFNNLSSLPRSGNHSINNKSSISSLSSLFHQSVPNLGGGDIGSGIGERNNHNHRSREDIYNSALQRAKQRQEMKNQEKIRNNATDSSNNDYHEKYHPENAPSLLSAHLSAAKHLHDNESEEEDEDKSIFSSIIRKVEKMYDECS